jgi:hypothetical protein
MDAARVKQNAFAERRLARVDVSGDTDVSKRSEVHGYRFSQREEKHPKGNRLGPEVFFQVEFDKSKVPAVIPRDGVLISRT